MRSAARARQPPLLPRDPAIAVLGNRRPARARRPRPRAARRWLAAGRHREAVRHDLASAQKLNREVGKVFRESQVYRIDHYLGKETVRNLMVFRFGNSLFEPIWNRRYVDHIQITVAESMGIENRGAFYEETERRATSCRTTSSSWSAWSGWSLRPRSRPTLSVTRRSRSCARSRPIPRRWCAASTGRGGWPAPRSPGIARRQPSTRSRRPRHSSRRSS